VSFDCWNENSEVAAFMRSKGYSGADLENYYEGRLLDIVGGPSVNKSYMVWQEIFNNGVKAKMDTVIDVWKGFDKKTMAEATKAGYKVCLYGGWYLDALKTTPGHFDGWDFYLQEPTDFEGSDEQKKLVMGGKAAMWGEHVDATNLLSRVWPRASCVAERLWSPASVNDEEAAKPRLHKFSCDLLARGIPAEPISPGGSIPGVPVQAQNAPGFCPHEFVFNYAPPGSGPDTKEL
jgi:hexosaminidase